jgi:hypothetical protein
MTDEVDRLIAVLERIAEAIEDSHHAAAFVAASVVMAKLDRPLSDATVSEALECLKAMFLADIRGEPIAEKPLDIKKT